MGYDFVQCLVALMVNTIYPVYLYSSAYYDLFTERDTNYFMPRSNLSILLAKDINSLGVRFCVYVFMCVLVCGGVRTCVCACVCECVCMLVCVCVCVCLCG